ncbi:MAG: gliding motility-associated C-terminal domain-containing protein [Bacteroidales bacterium]
MKRDINWLRGRAILLMLLPLIMGGSFAFGQTATISGVVNKYSRVVEMYERRAGSRVNAVKVTRPDSFAVDDVVMLYAPRGWLIDVSDGDAYAVPHYNTGVYSINKVDSILMPDSIIVFVAPTPFRDSLKKRDMAQLIKMPSFKKNVIVNGTISAQDWSASTGEGGVIALYVEGKLTLEADINASGKGFEGADPSGDNYTGGCYEDDTELYGSGYYPTSAMHLAGLKGEGSVATTFNDSLRGRYPVFNGGGGGNARFSGGGGGSNYSAGGHGGGQSAQFCTTTTATRGRGGISLSNTYYSNTLPANRLYFGGGGGTGTQTPAEPASAGGDGGGIVVIIADTIESTSAYTIRANGESVIQNAKAGAGGGGGGGTIVLDVSHYKGVVNLAAKGGNGGNTDNTYFTGPGGGGGGGLYWLSLKKDTASLFTNTGIGNGGEWLTGDGANGDPGPRAERLYNLLPPLNGFLFNSLPNDRTVCTDETPDTLFASKPKGGDGTYTFQWHYRHPDSLTWDSLVMDTLQYYVFKEPLTEPMELRRIVRSAGLEEGFDVTVTYDITPRIWGNTIAAPDEICYGLTAETLEQFADSTLKGADMALPSGDTTFKWIRRAPASSAWEDVPESFEHRYTPSGDTATTLYSRVVYSGVCDDTSNAVLITVLPSIKNNSIGDSDTLCFGQVSDDLWGNQPTGGDGNYTYVWEVSDDLVNWGDSLVSFSNVDFNLNSYDATRYIRRTIYSGEDSACIDTSEPVTITVLDTISNNFLIPDTNLITICQFNQLPGGGIDGTLPVGGDGNYQYYWQVRDKSNPWDDSATNAPGTKFNLEKFEDTTYIRRLVISGDGGVCQSYSDSLTVGIVWEITNNILTATPETYCQGDSLTTTLTADNALGGANGIGIQWQYKTSTTQWGQAPGVNSGNDYQYPDLLSENYYFRRYAWSELSDSVCFSYTDSVLITVQDSILQNDILLINDRTLNDDLDSICAGLDLFLGGTDEEQLTGGDETNYAYSWEESSHEDFSIVNNTGSSNDYFTTDFRDSAFFRRKVVSGECENTTYLLVHPIELPTGRLILADFQEDTLCSSAELPVEFEIGNLYLDPLASEYTAYVSYVSENNSGSNSFVFDRISTGPVQFPVFSDSAETYVYTLDSIIDNRQCKAEALDTFKPEVLVYYSPEATITAADTAVCGPGVTLTATNKGGVTMSWLASTVVNNLDGSDTVTINAAGLQAEAILDRWYNDTIQLVYGFKLETSGSLGMTCADSAYVTVTHYQEPELPPYFIKNDVDDFGDSIAIDSVYFTDQYPLVIDHPSVSGKGIWSIDDGSPGTVGQDPFNPQMVATLGDELDENNTFVWTVSNGVCPEQSDRMVIRRKDVEVYEGISPNGDGFNDVLTMRGIKHADKISLTIFNSWGTPIYRMTEQDEAQFVSLIPNEIDSDGLRVLWDGKVNGNVVPDGTYYYTIRFTINADTPRERSYDQKSFLIVSTQASE